MDEGGSMKTLLTTPGNMGGVGESPTKPLLELPARAQAALIAGALDANPVRGLTHNFYRYPARFSPAFVRAVIETFTEPGDLVLDPHVGGGTSLVEALALGRHAIGVDISALAQFIASVKTTVFTEPELSRLEAWAKRLPAAVHIRKPSIHFADYAKAGYYKHLDHPSRWRLRKAIEQGLGSAVRLGSGRLESFARCVVLRTAQWALDGRKKLPPIAEFKDMLVENAVEMIAGARDLLAAAKKYPELPAIRVIHRSTAGLEYDERMLTCPTPRLVVTSPPYPGIHVLYHRWQVDGRKEAPAPFWIANKLDGTGSSFYTMGDRKYPELATYFANIKATMSSVAALADEGTVVVQMVAFSDPSWQLPRYLETMEAVGLSEVFLPALQGEPDGRIWRRVSGHRWYNEQRGETPGSQEVVLIHVKQRPALGRVEHLSARLPSI
jgi:DNA methylase